MPTISRRHHYVPEFYLAGFTPAGTRDDQLWVIDRKRGKHWRQRPREMACERDYYRVDIDGVQPDAVEQALANLEQEASGAMTAIRDSRRLEGPEYETLLNFIAIQATRVPQFRENYVANKVFLEKRRLRSVLSDTAKFDRFLEDLAKNGATLPKHVTRESMLEFLEDDSRCEIRIPREAAIKNMLEMAEHLVAILARRNWTLFFSQGADFVCTDRPVVLIPTTPDSLPRVGFGQRFTEVLFPMFRRLAVVGHFDRATPTIDADNGFVGHFNRHMLQCAHRFAYSADEEVVFAE